MKHDIRGEREFSKKLYLSRYNILIFLCIVYNILWKIAYMERGREKFQTLYIDQDRILQISEKYPSNKVAIVIYTIISLGLICN